MIATWKVTVAGLAVGVALVSAGVVLHGRAVDARVTAAKLEERAHIARIADSAAAALYTPAVRQLRHERDSLSRLVVQLAPRTVKKSVDVRRDVAALSGSSRQRPDVATLAANADSLSHIADSLAAAAVQVITVTDTLQVIDSTAIRATNLRWSMERDTTAQLRVELMRRPKWRTVAKGTVFGAVSGAILWEVGRRVLQHQQRTR